MKICSKLLMSIMLLFGIIAINTSCKKAETFTDNNAATDSEITRQFFNLSPTEHPLVKRIAAQLKKLDDRNHFVADFAKTNGFAIWNKAILAPKPKTVLQRDGDGFELADSVVYVPLVLEDSLHVNGSILAKVKGDSIFFKYVLAQDYKAYPFAGGRGVVTANQFATLMFVLNREVFGHKTFNISDERLFADPSYPSPDTSTKQVSFDTAQVDNLNIPSTHCMMLSVKICGTNGTGRTGARTTPGPNNCLYYYVEHCYTIYDDSGGWGGSGGSTPPSGVPGGGGGGSSSIPHDYPCQTTNTCPPPGGGIGWFPILLTEPYVCTYQMTQEDIDIFNQIDEDDSLANLAYQNLDCKGTKRGGNIRFPGTMEHWLLQADYVSSNPTYGEIEFSIPGSSAAGNKGYADVVNTLNGNIFEIKPNNDAGILNGVTEVDRYVDKANLHCLSALPMGVAFNKTGTYSERNLPTKTPNTYLNAKLVAPGVIGYSYITTTNPIPIPVVAPNSMLDKFRELFERLRDNMSQFDQIISEYLRQHPELKTYIKNTAYGVAIAIVVATIVEDFATVGGGISDDWACFMLARRIVLFARAL